MSVTFEHNNLARPLRREVLEVLQASLVGAEPYRAVRRALEKEGDELAFGDRSIRLSGIRNVYVVGAGKAAARMAQAVEDVVGEWIGDGVVAVKDGYAAATSSIAVGEAAHPVPDRRSLKAARAISHVADLARGDDLVICLISGGGSSVVEIPAGRLALQDLREATATLLASGIPIEEINAIRKHLSAIKGGRLAEHVSPARHMTIVISDVVGDRIDLVASGPTVPDPTSYGDALEIVEREQLGDRLPFSVVDHLEAGAAGELDETLGADHPAFERGSARIVSSREDAIDAAEKAAVGAGYNPHVVTNELDGEARDVGREIARTVLELLETGEPVPRPACLLYAGETTVTVQGRGKGGRNQELALSAAVAMEEASTNIDAPVAIGAFATDGTDGPTTAAGAIVSTDTVERIRNAGFDARVELRDNNSNPVLEAAGDLIFTGPTCNNVNDMICVLVG